jgi:uroporphyrinogen decarboxylase
MNSRERMLCALAGGTPDRVPFGEVDVDPGVAQRIAGVQRQLTELEITRMLERDVLPLSAFPPIFADEERGSDGQVFYTRPWIQNESDLERIRWPDPLDGAFRKAAMACIRDGEGRYATVACIRLGISSTYLSMGFERFCLALIENAAFVQELLRRMTEWTVQRIDYLQEIGFDVLWSFDDLAYKSGLLVSPEMIRELVFPIVRPTVSRIRVPWVFHSDGDVMAVLDDLIELGIHGLHPLEPGPMDIRAVRRRYGTRLCLVGNVNVDTLTRGTTEEVEREVIELVRDVAPGGGYILTSANSIPPFARPENVVAMARAVQKHGKYPIAF